MTVITAALVKDLRERTGAGMMDCKKALVAADGDIEKAIEDMRKAGVLKAAKKAGRTAAEGTVTAKTSADGKFGIIFELNCETDFVARDENFIAFAEQVANTALAHKVADVETLLNTQLVDGGETIEQARLALITKLGENINLRRITCIDTTGVIGAYIHGGRIGVIVDVQSEDTKLAKDIAMHVAASHPIVVKSSDVPDELIEKERDIYTAQARESGKPDDIIEKMIGGRINKFLDEVSLLGQPFVKDSSMKVSQLLKSAGAEVLSFTRYEVGEGIEKKEDNFVAEVMSQVEDA